MKEALERKIYLTKIIVCHETESTDRRAATKKMPVEPETHPLESTKIALKNDEKTSKMSGGLSSARSSSSSINKDVRKSSLQSIDNDSRCESREAPHNKDNQDVSLINLVEELQQAVAKDRKKFHEAVNMPVSEKAKNMRTFSLELCRDENKQVAKIFVFFSVAMFTVPLVVLTTAIKLCEISGFKSSSSLIGGLSSIGSVIVIMAAYVLYAFYEAQSSSRPDEGVSTGRSGDEKRQRHIFSKEKKD